MVYISRLAARTASGAFIKRPDEEEGDDMVDFLEKTTGIDLDGDGQTGRSPKHWRQQSKWAMRSIAMTFMQKFTAPKVGESVCVLASAVARCRACASSFPTSLLTLGCADLTGWFLEIRVQRLNWCVVRCDVAT